ncbi:MAG TPA: hypothetical protein VLT58_05190 [Polyangia bacterium]|nr:hypothetical protein [Polyangia bacterium]
MKPLPMRMVRTLMVVALGASGTLLTAGCDGSGKAAGTDGGGATGDSPVGVVLGPLDSHCNAGDGGQHLQDIGVCQVDDPASVPANKSTCGVSFSNDAGVTTTGADDAGAGSDAGADSTSGDYRPTVYGSAAYDDDCKYYVSWVATPIKENADTYFTVTAIRAADGKPASCAGIRPDISLSLAHGVAAPKNPAPEIAPGVYKVGPIRFDAPGNTPGHYWTVRFHLYEECNDSPEDSPHGHAAFYVSVP